MKKIFTITLLAAAVAFTGCESVGLKTIKMDSAESLTRVAETIEKHIDNAEYKVVSAYWYEREELSNNLEYMLVEMVGTDGALYSQTFKVGGDNQGPAEMKESRSNRKYDFATMNHLTAADFDAAQINGYIETAKTEIPEEYSFESVHGYTLRVDPANGEKTSDFDIYVTEKGNKTSVQGRNVVTTYYEIEFQVEADGTVVMED